jgi:hypothetical protein
MTISVQCSFCRVRKPEDKFPFNYGKRNGSTCLECRNAKYKTRTEIARSKVHAEGPHRKKCIRCLAIGLGSKAHPVKKGNYFFCDKHFALASNVPEEYQGW